MKRDFFRQIFVWFKVHDRLAASTLAKSNQSVFDFTVTRPPLTLLLAVAAGEEAGFVLGCPLVRLCSVVAEDPDVG